MLDDSYGFLPYPIICMPLIILVNVVARVGKTD